MKKVLTLVCGFILTSSVVFAGPTSAIDSVLHINASNAKTNMPANLLGKDYLGSVDLGASSLPSFTTGASIFWDMRNIAYDTTVMPVVNRVYAIYPYKFGDSLTHPFGSTVKYKTQLLATYALDGVTAHGVHIDSQSVFVNSPVAGVDTMTFPDQDTFFTAPYQRLPFPCTYNTSWSSNFSYTPAFMLTDTALGYDQKPGNFSIHYMQQDSVVGHGAMIVLEPDSTLTDSITVLQVKTMTTEVDSFFLAGNPMSSSMLSAFGFTQGNTTNTYSMSFYRLGRITPLVQIYFTDNTYSIANSVNIDTLNFTAPSGIKLSALGNDVTVYPNPVSNHTVHIDLGNGAKSGQWSYQLINVSGQMISNGILPQGQQKASINIPASVAPGVYYLEMANNGTPACIKPVQVIQ